MTNQRRGWQALAGLAKRALWAGGLAAFSAQSAQFNVRVVDADGDAVSGFRYVVQEDRNFAVDPANPPPRSDMLSFNFARSNHPVARYESGAQAGAPVAGHTPGDSVQIDGVPGSPAQPGRYYVSVLPYSGHSIGGAPVAVDGSAAADVTVVVQKHPIPTAQVALFLFEDNYPLSGAPDLPEEENPPAGSEGADGLGPVDWTQFSIVLEEPAGLYGQNGGPVLQDAFGNQLGSEYQPGCNPTDPTSPDPIGAGPCVTKAGDGTLHPDAQGYLLVKNLAPGKYGVVVNPPASSPQWVQTSTIEGTKVIDAWVKANEPPFFVEFGMPGPHVFVGFVRTDRVASDLLAGSTTVSGTVTDLHMSRPPNYTFFSGRPFPGCWVALNEGGLVPGRTLYAGPCDADSGFSIPGVADGNYELKVFDANLDVVIATQPLAVEAGNCNGGNSCDLGDVAVFNWFNRLSAAVFNDVNQNGFWDEGEGPVGPEGGPVSIRWRDGVVYQGFGTDGEGLAPFDEVFPFFHWLVAEVGFANKKATGATFVADAGGPVDTAADEFPGFGALTPLPPRTETGPVLTQAFQGFLGQTNVMQFGKAEYLDFDKSSPLPFDWTYVGEDGGISGLVHYATTRAEHDPRFAVGDTWEPGLPWVQVAVYADGDIDCDTNPMAGSWPDGVCDIDWNQNGVRDPDDGVADSLDGVDSDGDGHLYDLADVDNYPFGWAAGGVKGPEDVDRNGNGAFDFGDALQVTWTDSWDDSTPTACQGANAIDIDLDGSISADEDSRCFDGLRNFNQVRPGVFDGGYAFSDYALDRLPAGVAAKLEAFYSAIRARPSGAGGTLGDRLPEAWMLPGDYVVQAATPPGYKLVKEEDKNVDYGDDYVPSPLAFDPVCVGDARPVPELLSIATADGSGDLAQLLPGLDREEAAAPFAGEVRPLCDRKAVPLSAAQNAAANFFLFTDTPIAAKASGMILNDLANEFNPNAPNFGEKYAPPYVPVAFYDWNGDLVNRVYADEYGRFNALLPSTWTVNLPLPSGMSPNMLVSCMNDAGPIPNPELGPGNPDVPELIVDPYFNPRYSQFCYTFQYMPGAITYLDTPVVSIAAFSNPEVFPADCERAGGRYADDRPGQRHGRRAGALRRGGRDRRHPQRARPAHRNPFPGPHAGSQS